LAAGVVVRRALFLAAVGAGIVLACVGSSLAAVHDADAESRRDPFQRVVPAEADPEPAAPFARLRVGGFVAFGGRQLALLVDDAQEAGFIVEQGTLLPTAAARVQALQPNAVLLADMQGGAATWVSAGEGEGTWLVNPSR